MRSMPSSIFTTIVSMAMMASSTSRPSARIRAPSVTRSNTRPVSSMMTNTAAKRQGNGSGHDDADAPAEAQQTDDKHDAEGDEELEHELIDGLGNVDRLVGDLAQGDAERQTAGDRLGFRLECLAEVQTVPALLHDHAQRKSGFALVADQEGGRILIAAAHFGDVRELEVAAARYDWGVGDLLEIVIGAVETHEHLRPLGVDRARRRDGVLALQRREDVLRA